MLELRPLVGAHWVEDLLPAAQVQPENANGNRPRHPPILLVPVLPFHGAVKMKHSQLPLEVALVAEVQAEVAHVLVEVLVLDHREKAPHHAGEAAAPSDHHEQSVHLPDGT